MGFNTSLLHGAAVNDKYGATQPPIYQVSAFSHDSAETLEKVFANRAPGFSYSRIGNPTVDAFEKRIAALEGGIGAVACSSGMSAVTMALLNILKAGDEVIAGAGLFGGTIELFADLKQFGITARFVDEVTAESIAPLINERTRAVFTELIGNPKLNVADIKSVAGVCHGSGIPLIIDSTTATPYLVHPFEHGADIVVHSASKYINGGGNSIAGIIIDSGKFRWDSEKYPEFDEYGIFGKFAYLAKLRNGFWRNAGACIPPFNAYMCSVGLETLGLRMERICYNAKKLAGHLQTLDGVTVNYPGLETSPYFPLVQSQFGGRGGGILTIRAGSKEKAFRLINSLKYALIATNIGDIRTLVIHPASTIYLHSTAEQRERAGVYDDTIRVSVGIEDINDLTEDFENAIKGEKQNG
ncbi:MAG: PLP-dependent transferase [Ruminiclostridium sp.]|nr:PLP-dependent transferase [Ruminiclostridium sp.]